ncbi:MAG: DUF438 domain-containing protein [Ignavibacteriae bacterium HGW-Ignavibacteriae-2]|jgi:hypothetical protein|nr:MAG: DUF438 domain-containing protein [Ignavibacteriae bacterium HGW-Ignavibacteriae-2]
MSEFINNSKIRVGQLKELIKKLHDGQDIGETRKALTDLMGSVPYGEVIQAEEELIRDGMPREEILKFCDLHTEALKGTLQSKFSSDIPEGHPVDVFLKENKEIQKVITDLKNIFEEIKGRHPEEECRDLLTQINIQFNSLMDLEKHYQKKENLLFPYLEKYDITGPPMVMWGKDDEVRELLKSSQHLFSTKEVVTTEVLQGFIEMMFGPAIKSIEEMIYKEEKILFPMSLDTLTEIDWHTISEQSDDMGYCLYYPNKKWNPDTLSKNNTINEESDKIKLSTGSFTKEELEAMINSLPIDLTFVDKNDRVKYFSHGKERIFQRPKTILGRQVQYCHPPSSVHIVNQIVEDFKSGKQDSAKFWINFQEKFVHIAYYPVHNEKGEYLGTVEMSQNLNEYRAIEGERRILEYDTKDDEKK